jgi:hypothetical protein
VEVLSDEYSDKHWRESNAGQDFSAVVKGFPSVMGGDDEEAEEAAEEE